MTTTLTIEHIRVIRRVAKTLTQSDVLARREHSITSRDYNNLIEITPPSTVHALCDMAEKWLSCTIGKEMCRLEEENKQLLKALRACVAELDSAINNPSVIDMAGAVLGKYDKVDPHV